MQLLCICISIGMKVYITEEKELIMEPCFKWAGNPNILVAIKAFGLKATVQVIDLQVFASPRITLKPLVPTFPCFAKITVSLMEKPHVDFGLKLFGADAMSIPGLYRFVQETIKQQVANMYLWPKTLEVPILDPSKAFKKPVGILQVKVVRAMKLKKKDLMGASDPYVKLKLTEEKLSTKKTTVKHKNLNPEWNEEFQIVVKDPESQALEFTLLCICISTGMKVYITEEKELIMEPCFKWAGNPNILVAIKAFGLKATVQVIDLQVFASPRITLKPLVPTFPCFAKITVSLMEKPHVDFGLKLFGADAMSIPGLYRFVQETIKQQVANMYLWPKTLEVPILDPSKAFKKPVGILQVKVVRAMKLKKKDLMGASDPYVKLKLTEEKLSTKKTTVKHKNLNPEWNEEFQIVVKDPESQALEFTMSTISSLFAVSMILGLLVTLLVGSSFEMTSSN
uniref:Uncharacterized protein n=1 Tax=Kalanchoe fedtschenkoi TaxID=63787 RepID=A0A7N1A824_KALFE